MKGAINKNLSSQTIPDVVLSLLGAGEKIAEDDLNAREAHYKYLKEKMDEHLDKLWDEGILDQKRLDEINKMDLHQLK